MRFERHFNPQTFRQRAAAADGARGGELRDSRHSFANSRFRSLSIGRLHPLHGNSCCRRRPVPCRADKVAELSGGVDRDLCVGVCSCGRRIARGRTRDQWSRRLNRVLRSLRASMGGTYRFALAHRHAAWAVSDELRDHASADRRIIESCLRNGFRSTAGLRRTIL